MLLVGDATAPLDFPLAGAPGESPAVGEPIADQPKPFAGLLFDGDQEVGVAMGEVEEKGRFAYSAFTVASFPSSSTASRSGRRAWISPWHRVA